MILYAQRQNAVYTVVSDNSAKRIFIIDGDTEITMHGKFSIEGYYREAFFKKLAALIDEYRI